MRLSTAGLRVLCQGALAVMCAACLWGQDLASRAWDLERKGQATEAQRLLRQAATDRKSTRLNSSHT